MEDIEKSILEWYIENYPEYSTRLKQQLDNCVVSGREFTSGGGVIVSVIVKVDTPKLQLSESVAQIEGPFIISPELESDASVGLGVNELGVIEYLEIWSHCNDYPYNRHVQEYKLVEPKVNYIELGE